MTEARGICFVILNLTPVWDFTLNTNHDFSLSQTGVFVTMATVATKIRKWFHRCKFMYTICISSHRYVPFKWGMMGCVWHISCLARRVVTAIELTFILTGAVTVRARGSVARSLAADWHNLRLFFAPSPLAVAFNSTHHVSICSASRAWQARVHVNTHNRPHKHIASKHLLCPSTVDRLNFEQKLEIC